MKRAFWAVAAVATVAALAWAVRDSRSDREFRDLVSRGEEAAAAGDHYAAIELLTGALAVRPDSMVAFYRRGQAYRAQRRDAEARRDFLDAVRLAPEAPQPLVALAELHDSRHEPAEAARWYDEADRLTRDDAAIQYALALSRYRAGSPAAAIEPLRRALGRNDSLAEAHYLLGLVLRDTGDAAGAVESLRAAVRSNPTLVAAREELVDVYRHLGRSGAEMAELQALATTDPGPHRSVDVALALARTGQIDQALAALSALRRTAPDDPRVLLGTARVHLLAAETSRDRARSAAAAEAVLERALGGSARRSEGLALLGRAMYLTGRYDDALRMLQEATATSPVVTEAFAYLADVAERTGHHLDARNALLDLDAMEGGAASAGDRAARAARIGALSLETLDYVVAAAHLTRAVAGRPWDVASLLRLAQARWAIGDQPGALEALAQARALAPRDPNVLRLSRTIRASVGPGGP